MRPSSADSTTCRVPTAVPERATEQDEPVSDEAVHEGGVLGPLLLFADAAGVVPIRPVDQGQREVRRQIVREGETGWLVPIDDGAAPRRRWAPRWGIRASAPGAGGRAHAGALSAAGDRGPRRRVLREAADTRPAAPRRAASAS